MHNEALLKQLGQDSGKLDPTKMIGYGAPLQNWQQTLLNLSTPQLKSQSFKQFNSLAEQAQRSAMGPMNFAMGMPKQAQF